MILFFLMAGMATAAAQEDQDIAILEARATALEQRYDRESDNPRRQTEIAVDLSKNRFDQLRSVYDTGDPELWKESLEAYRGAVDRLETAVVAARNAGNSKKAEVFLRRHSRDLENLKTSVSYLDRPEIEKLCDRAASLRERILYSILNPDEN
jgi:hypothetical protein